MDKARAVPEVLSRFLRFPALHAGLDLCSRCVDSVQDHDVTGVHLKALDSHHIDALQLSFVLFDEIEKANDALWHLLLGIFGDRIAVW